MCFLVKLEEPTASDDDWMFHCKSICVRLLFLSLFLMSIGNSVHAGAEGFPKLQHTKLSSSSSLSRVCVTLFYLFLCSEPVPPVCVDVFVNGVVVDVDEKSTTKREPNTSSQERGRKVSVVCVWCILERGPLPCVASFFLLPLFFIITATFHSTGGAAAAGSATCLAILHRSKRCVPYNATFFSKMPNFSSTFYFFFLKIISVMIFNDFYKPKKKVFVCLLLPTSRWDARGHF